MNENRFEETYGSMAEEQQNLCRQGSLDGEDHFMPNRLP